MIVVQIRNTLPGDFSGLSAEDYVIKALNRGPNKALYQSALMQDVHNKWPETDAKVIFGEIDRVLLALEARRRIILTGDLSMPCMTLVRLVE